MRIDRYFLGELSYPLLGGFFLLTAIFAAYMAAGVLADSAAGALSPTTIWEIVGLRCLIAAEIILPTALFFSVVFAFERLNRDRELVAMLAGGFSRAQMLRPVALVGVLVLCIVAMLSIQTRPWAYRVTYLLEDLAARPDISLMQPGRFYEVSDGLVVSGGQVDVEGRRLLDVFARQADGDQTRIIRADEAVISAPDDSGVQIIEFRDGQAWLLSASGLAERRHDFQRLRYRWSWTRVISEVNNRRAVTTARLSTSERPKDVAELQWRFTMPVMTLAMTLVAGALGTLSPGRTTGRRIVLAILAYVVIFNIAAGARTAMENGWLPFAPGIFWVPLVPLALMALLLWRGNRAA